MKLRKLAAALIIMTLAVNVLTVSVNAYDSYQVTVSAGLHGTFNGEEIKSKLVENNVASAEDIKIIDSKTIQVTMKKDKEWNPNDYEPVVDDDKYYFKGYHESGIEGQLSGAQTVNEDIVFVATYGIRGEMVEYYVYYLDAQGNELHARSVLRGNVGDKPVVAYVYIPGYVPDVKNQGEKELSKDEVTEFTFNYEPAPSTTIYEEVIVPSDNVPVTPAQNEAETTPDETVEPVPTEDIPEPVTPAAEPDNLPDNSDNSETDNGSPISVIMEYALKFGLPALLLLLLLFLLLRKRRNDEE